MATWDLCVGKIFTTTFIEPGVIDANILVYAINPESSQHAGSNNLLEGARNPANTLFVTSQIICEFYSIITNPRRVAVPRPAADALTIVSDLLAFPGLHVLPSPRAAVQRLIELLGRRRVIGRGVFDLQIVATMLANDIRRIYTFNVRDFRIFRNCPSSALNCAIQRTHLPNAAYRQIPAMIRTLTLLILSIAPVAFAADIAGEYTGTWSSDSGSSDGKLHLTVTKSADTWDCKLAYSGGDQPEVTPKPVSCTVTAGKLKAQYETAGDDGKQNITLEAAMTGDALQGTYKVAADGGEALDSGKWKASAAH